jgi:hypothetical protein
VRYVLEAPGHHRPTGQTVVVGDIGNEKLVFIPASAPATLSPVPPGGGRLPVDAPGTLLSVTNPDPSSWRVVVDASTTSILRLRLTAVPGWHATIDGRSLALQPWASGLMLQARVPAGHHVVELHYWPTAFTAGLAVAGVVFVGLAAAIPTAVVLGRRRRRVSPAP